MFWGMRNTAKRLITYNLRPSDIRTILAGLEILKADEPRWRAEIEELASILQTGLDGRKASKVLASKVGWSW